jgi:hypothetical protein
MDELGTTSLVTHEVILNPDAQPYYYTSNKRVAPVELKFIREELDRLLAAHLIIPMQSEWCAPITIATKKDGTLRMCIAYCQLNDRTIRESFTIPLVEDVLDRSVGFEFNPYVDGLSGYNVIPVRKEDIV